MTIYIKGCFGILGKIFYDESYPEYDFKLKIDNIPITITLNLKDKKIITIGSFEPPQEALDVLGDDINDNDLVSDMIRSELNEYLTYLIRANRRVMNNIKYSLNQPSLKEGLITIKKYHWSKDKINWKNYRFESKHYGSTSTQLCLNKDKAVEIQELIERDVPETLIALRFLHKAKNESLSKYKWIYASIAAELAIKEFFSKKKPELTPLLIECPSPPLHKMYNTILEKYIHEKSLKYKEIQKGAVKRNKLVHSFEKTEIDLQKSIEYIQDVEIAIYQLLNILYPENKLIKEICCKQLFLIPCKKCGKLRANSESCSYCK